MASVRTGKISVKFLQQNPSQPLFKRVVVPSEWPPGQLRLALELHFSAAPAKLAAELLPLAVQQGLSSMQRLRQGDWHRAALRIYALAGADSCPSPIPSWERWQRSLPKAIRLATLLSTQPGASTPSSPNIHSQGSGAIDEFLLVYGGANYPSALQQLYRPPFLLFARGNQRLLQPGGGSGFAVCGSRKASLHGRRDAFALAYGVCCHSDFYLVTGLTEGIELAACQGALQAYRQRSAGAPADLGVIAVLCSGLAAIAPQESQQMAQQILRSGGLLLSEYPPQQARQRFAFLQRNRILAALAASLIMVELNPKTKALNLVEFALELNRDVAVLGQSGGVQALAEQGCAHWADSPALLDALGMPLGRQASPHCTDSAPQNIAPVVAQEVYAELTDQGQGYLGQRIACP